MSFVCYAIISQPLSLIRPEAIVEDARTPQKYRMLLSTVDAIFADVAQPDQARIVALNAEYFLKNEGNVIISIKASCIDSTAPPETVFAREVQFLKDNKFKPLEQVTLEPYERDHAMVTGTHLKCIYLVVKLMMSPQPNIRGINSSLTRLVARDIYPSCFLYPFPCLSSMYVLYV